MKDDLTFFEDRGIRRVYDEATETWLFSVVDIIGVLTESDNPRRYWSDLKRKLTVEGSEVYEKIVRLKLTAEDGKKRLTDVADAETLLRLVQSVPSPKAEPVKLWLAKMGYERIQEMADPELALNRSCEYWRQHGRSEKWIEQRMLGQQTRNKLTDYWKDHDIKEGKEYAILTGIIHKEWAGISVKQHKDLKGLETQNLRDHMTEAELIFTALAELSTRQIAESMNATGLQENAEAGKRGGGMPAEISKTSKRNCLILDMRGPRFISRKKHSHLYDRAAPGRLLFTETKVTAETKAKRPAAIMKARARSIKKSDVLLIQSSTSS